MFSLPDPLATECDLLTFYQQHFTDSKNIRIGIEWERNAVHRESITPVSYLEKEGFNAILHELVKRYGWEVEDGIDDHYFTLKRGTARITIEGDGKPEISGSPFLSLAKNEEELREIEEEIEEISEEKNIQWIPMGMSPFFHPDEIEIVPKPRYLVWDKCFPDHHAWVHRFMKTLTGIHINISTSSEADLLQKTLSLFRLSPLLVGAFANSPYENGKNSELASARRRATFTDSLGRENMMHGFLDKDFSLEKWIQWYLDQDVFLIARGEETFVPERGFTFRKYITEGYKGIFPTFSDFDAHIKTCWTDIRFRVGYVEFRSLDSLPLDLTMGVTALIKGLVWSKEGHAAIVEATANWKEEDFTEIHKRAWEKGGKAEWNGVSFFQILKKLLPIAKKTLEAEGKGEEKYLETLLPYLEQERTPGEDFDMEKYSEGRGE